MRALFSIGSVIVASVLLIGADEKPADHIKILFVDPPGPVARGLETEFTVDVEADLKSEDEGVAHIGFNSETPTSFRMQDSHLLGHGSQRFTFKVKVIPPDWGDRAKFKVMVNMGPRSVAAKWDPTAWDDRDIEVRP